MNGTGDTFAAGLLDYWRDCLADEAIAGIDYGTVRKFPIITLESLQLGTIGPDIARGVRPDNAAASEPVDVLVTLGRLSPEYLHAIPSRDEHAAVPLWIPASLASDGSLKPQEDRHPFIARKSLEPSSSAFACVGTLSDADEFYTKYVVEHGWETSWTAALAWAFKLWEHVSGSPWHGYAPEDAAFAPEDIRIVRADAGFDLTKITGCLEDAARHIRAGGRLPLITGIIHPTPPRDTSAFAWSSRSGHAGPWALSSDQRSALDHILATPVGRLQAVNGPPGTGKTTLLRSVIASTVVNAAVSATDPFSSQPPLIVVTSTNNTAVTNALDALAEIPRPTPISERWVNAPEDYGVYLVSQSREARAGTYPTFPPQEGGTVRETFNKAKANIKTMSASFVDRYNDAFTGSITSVRQAVVQLHARAVESNERLRNATKAWNDYGRIAQPNEVSARNAMLLRHRLDQRNARVNLHRSLERKDATMSEVEGQTSRLGDTLDALQPTILEACLLWLPPIRQRIYRRFEKAYGRNAPLYGDLRALEAHVRKAHNAFCDHEDAAIAEYATAQRALDQLIRDNESEVCTFDAICTTWASHWSQLRSSTSNEASSDTCTSKDVEEALDLGLRTQAFNLSMRFWEGRWLDEMLLFGEGFWKPQDRDAVLRRYRCIAKLYPCFAVTLHSLPWRFDHFVRVPQSDGSKGYGAPLFEAIDLLIVDEAGQVPPHIGMAGLALARRAIIVGDVHQLEPIVNLDEALSILNLRKKLGNSIPLDDLRRRGFLTHNEGGNLMQVAQHATTYTLPGARVPGSFLSSHHRCVPAIIQYCDDLVYHGLHAVRAPLEGAPYPALGYAFIRGRSTRIGKSRRNEAEAQIITAFIKEQKAVLLATYAEKVAALPARQRLAAIIAIVTPYASQANHISELLRSALPDDELPIVGTAYAMQGAEAHVVIYSNVYSPRDNIGFANRKPNLINVAVSRAKDHFLFFGDISTIDRLPIRSPLGLLAKHLMGSGENPEENRLSGVPPAYYGPDVELERIDSLERHREILEEALTRSGERVFICSPFLANAVTDDPMILPGLRKAVERGVDVDIVSSPAKREDIPGKTAALGALLRGTGADWRYVNQIHAKTLYSDDSMLYEGSFNWLSASRSEPLRNYEAGIVIRGPHAAIAIQEIRRYFDDESMSQNMTFPIRPG